MNDLHTNSTAGPNSTLSSSGGNTNAAIGEDWFFKSIVVNFNLTLFFEGVVIPTTPNSAAGHLQQQHHDHVTNAYIANHSNIRSSTNQPPPSTYDRSDSNQEQHPPPPQSSTVAAVCASNVEDRLNQIQEYIRITSSLINSIQTDKVSNMYGKKFDRNLTVE